MTDSILNSTKKILGLSEADTTYDLDILMHINTVFSTLEQLGVGPAGGFLITDSQDEWVTFLGGDSRLNSVKSYMALRVRLLFDPPSTSFAITAIQEQIREFEWRLTVAADPGTTLTDAGDTIWITDTYDPIPAGVDSGDITINPTTGDVWRVV